MGLIVNLYGHQGSGKTTCAAYLAATLAFNGISAYVVGDYVKRQSLKRNELPRTNPLQTGLNLFDELMGAVERGYDVIVMECPLRQVLIYQRQGNCDSTAYYLDPSIYNYDWFRKGYKSLHFNLGGLYCYERFTNEVQNLILPINEKMISSNEVTYYEDIVNIVIKSLEFKV